jgi:formylglycine-generating enzyme required for sulfatase activity
MSSRKKIILLLFVLLAGVSFVGFKLLYSSSAGFHYSVDEYVVSIFEAKTTAKNHPPIPGEAWTVPLKLSARRHTGLEMEWVNPGEFQMGSPTNEPNRNNDETPHTVRISKPYWLGKYEVTQAQWSAVMGGRPSFFRGVNHPVDNVSWHDAMAFCEKLTKQEHSAGRLPAGYHYTLPTEAEWEYACRAGTTGEFAGTLEETAWYDSRFGTHRVGEKEPNRWGFYDMHGNVWEWCRDWYGSYPADSVSDPVGPRSGSQRINRGGGWDYVDHFCRSAARFKDKPFSRDRSLGFRLALSSIMDEE